MTPSRLTLHRREAGRLPAARVAWRLSRLAPLPATPRLTRLHRPSPGTPSTSIGTVDEGAAGSMPSRARRSARGRHDRGGGPARVRPPIGPAHAAGSRAEGLGSVVGAVVGVPVHAGGGDSSGEPVAVHDGVVPTAQQGSILTGRSRRRRPSAGRDAAGSRNLGCRSRGSCSRRSRSSTARAWAGLNSRAVRPRSSTSPCAAEQHRDDPGVARDPPRRRGGEQGAVRGGARARWPRGCRPAGRSGSW